MQLYKFYLSTWKTTTINRTVLEVEEKPKTYIQAGRLSDTRISKSDIGVLSGYDNSTLYLLEDDIQKAKEIFIKSLESKISAEKRKIETTIQCCNERIANYEKGILTLSENAYQALKQIGE